MTSASPLFTFDNTFDALGGAFYQRVTPRGLHNPRIVCVDATTADTLGLTHAQQHSAELKQALSGNRTLPGSTPLAMVYAGHQFGGYSAQLGDGRGLLLGEVEHQKTRWDIHLKGAGLTPYSRFGDGYAVLRSCIREYLASIALRGLGIPTTHALCIIRGDDPVERETIEPAATLTRIARSHIRFGSFEYFHYTQQHEQVRLLADYVIEHFLPEHSHTDDRYEQLFLWIVTQTAHLIAHWQAVGFAHGVLNTDNMSIIGETLDYGPYGFMETYQPGFICNHSDTSGRYAFDQQPAIGLWNLQALAQAFNSLVSDATLQDHLEHYPCALTQHYTHLMRYKLGLLTEANSDLELIGDVLEILKNGEIDYTHYFRHLSHLGAESHQGNTETHHILTLCSQKHRPALAQWLTRYQQRLTQETLSAKRRSAHMLAHNPKFILRNYMAHQAIEEAYEHHHYSEIHTLEKILKAPYEEHPEHEAYAKKAPEWAKTLSVSCSS